MSGSAKWKFAFQRGNDPPVHMRCLPWLDRPLPGTVRVEFRNGKMTICKVPDELPSVADADTIWFNHADIGTIFQHYRLPLAYVADAINYDKSSPYHPYNRPDEPRYKEIP